MVGLSQPGTRQKYHRISESESIAHVKVVVEPTTMTAFDEVVVIPPSTIYKLRGSTVRTYCSLGLTENCVWRQANANGVFRKFWIQSFWICKTSYTSSHTYSFIILGCGLTTYNKDFDDDGLGRLNVRRLFMLRKIKFYRHLYLSENFLHNLIIARSQFFNRCMLLLRL